MLRHKPKFTYCGLTIILSQPSRFDKKQLIEGVASYFFEEECLRPDINRYQCDIRLDDDDSPFLPGTKCLLVLGAKAHSKYSPQNTTLDENRGSPYFFNGLPVIASFSPQDAVDMMNWEARFNEHLREDEDEEFESDEANAGEMFESKGRGKTSRANYRFWLKADVKKAIKIVDNDGKLPHSGFNPQYTINTDPDRIISKLTETKNQHFFFDCETDFFTYDMRCFAFSFDNTPEDIITVPVLDYNYKPFYGFRYNALIYKALSVAARDNILVAHNGSSFDYFILAHKYGIPIRRVYDTMIASHRCFPTIEKSLGHCISLATFEGYHKNMGIHGYHNSQQADQLYLYCGMDVYTMFLLKRWQDEMASKDAGLKESINSAMEAIPPYLLMTLAGMNFNDKERQLWINKNDRMMEQLMRVMRVLTGEKVEPLISNKKCVKYFHDLLGYRAAGRTKANKPSLAKENLFKLALKEKNPVIPLLIKYRELQKETGTLQFKTWRQ